MTFDYKILEEKMSQLSPEMQSALTSVEISQAIQDISKKYDLKIDQEGILFDHTAYIMLGLLPSKSFAQEFSQEAQIDEKKSQLIATDINQNVFDKIRESMHQIEDFENEKYQEKPEDASQSTISSIEQAGGFSIEKEKINPNKTRPDGAWKMPEEGEIELPEEILRHIEEHKLPTKPVNNVITPTSTPKPTPVAIPNPTTQTITNPQTSNQTLISSPVKSSWEKDNEQHTEPLVDHLLTKTTSIPLEKSSQTVTEMPKKSVPPPNNIPTGPDMYKESII